MSINYPIVSLTLSTHIPMGAIGRPSRSNSINMSINYPIVSPIPSSHVPMGTL